MIHFPLLLKYVEPLQGLHLECMKILIVEHIRQVLGQDVGLTCVQTNGQTHGCEEEWDKIQEEEEGIDHLPTTLLTQEMDAVTTYAPLQIWERMADLNEDDEVEGEGEVIPRDRLIHLHLVIEEEYQAHQDHVQKVEIKQEEKEEEIKEKEGEDLLGLLVVLGHLHLHIVDEIVALLLLNTWVENQELGI